MTLPAQPAMQAPAFLTARASRNLTAAAAAGISSAQPPRISIQGNRFTLIDAAGNERPHTVTMINPATGQQQQFLAPHLDAVIIGVNMNVSKLFYETAFDPNVEGAPVCWSDNGQGPSQSASKPQSLACASCPQNQWGSAISNMSGKQVKACADARKIAVILPGDPIVYQLRVPPATLKILKNYANMIAGYSLQGPDGRPRGADLSDVVTRIEFEPGQQGVLKFSPVSFIDESLAAHMDAITQEKLDAILGLNDRPIASLPGAAQPAPAQIVHQPQQHGAPQPAVYVSPQPYTPPQGHVSPQGYVPPQPQPVQPGQQHPPLPITPAQFVAAQPVQAPGGIVPPNGPVAPAATAPKRGRGRPTTPVPTPPPAPIPGQPQPAPAGNVMAPGVTVLTGPPAMVVAHPGPTQPVPAQQPAQQWSPPAMAAPPGAPQPQPTNFGMTTAAPAQPSQEMQDAVLAAMNFKTP